MHTEIIPNMVVSFPLMIVLFVARCDPHPHLFSDKHSALYQDKEERYSSPNIDGGEKTTNTNNVINSTVFLPASPTGSLQDKSFVMTKSSGKEPELKQPTHAEQMRTAPPPFLNRFSSPSQITSSVGTTIKRRSPGADAKRGEASKEAMNEQPDFPSLLPPPEKGVPTSLLDMEWSDSRDHLVLKLDKEYTPREIADYIYNTGDEKGITQAVWEMLQDGQIMESTEDVILFLEAVQKELVKMQQEKKPKHSPSQRMGIGRGRVHSRRRIT